MTCPRGAGRRARSATVVLAAALAAGAAAAPTLGLSVASAATPAGSAASGASALVRIGSAPVVPAGAHATGALDPSHSVDVGLSLEPRDPAALARYAAAVSTPGSSDYHHYLTPLVFADRFGPTRASVRVVEHAMIAAGLAVGQLSANRLLLDVRGKVATVESAFHTRITGYRLAGGREGWATTSAPAVPRAAAEAIQAVIGVDDLAVPQSQLRRAPRVPTVVVPEASRAVRESAAASAPGAPRGCAAAKKDAISGGGWTDGQVASAYGLSGLYARGDLGQGQTIALFELEPFSLSDVATFDTCYFGTSHTDQITTVPVDGFDLVGPGSGESILDIDDLSALVPAAKIIVYEAPNTTFGGIDEYNTIVSQDRANIVSTSWGECESALQTAAPGTQQLENYIFEEAAAQGQTVVSAAGDTGSDDCAGTQFGTTTAVSPYLSVDDPASQPYVLGVGGTSLLTDANPPSQTVWNHGSQWGGGGGGLSSTWPIPAWQADSGVPGVATSGYREVPDVSASADEWRGITVYSSSFGSGSSGGSGGSGWTTIGGTSSAAPTWAAALAEIAASGGACASLPVTAGGADLGFAAPELYGVAADPVTYAQSFSDITSGNNDVFGLGLGYSAGPGFDLASGLGTPLVTDAAGVGGLDASLCDEAATSSPVGARPAVTAVSPASGPVGGGSSVTISGSGFPAGSPSEVHVSFGTATATVTAVTATSVTVTAPPSDLAAAAAPVLAAGRVDVVVTVSSPSGSESSQPSASSSYEYVDGASSAGAPPTVSGVGPSGGNVAGGGTVTIYGSGFGEDGAPRVSFGGVVSPEVRVLSSSEISAVVPPESSSTSCAAGPGFDAATACQVEVVVSDAAGSSPSVPILPALSGAVAFTPQGIVAPTPETEVAPSATEYDYAPTPTISSVSPDPADASGSTPVTITGTGFDFDTFDWVNFGPATSSASEQVQISEITPTEIVVTPPAGTSGVHALDTLLEGGVSVQSAGGLSNVYRFAYAGVPSVRSISALGGPSTGGTRLVVRGTGLADVTSVDFTSQVSAATYGASTTSVISDVRAGSLTVVSPAGLPGPVDVEPCTPTGCARPDPQTDTFVYFTSGPAQLSLVTPRAGPASGGTEVVLFGDNLDGAVGVRFGSHSTDRLGSVTGYPDGDPYVLVADSAPGTAGTTVKVTVVTRSGTARTIAGGTFHYRPSAPSPPRGVSLHLGRDDKVTMRWDAPASDGGSQLTSYTLLATAAGEAPAGGVVSASTRHALVGPIAADRAYTFRIRASNVAHGAGPWATFGPYDVGYSGAGYRLASSSGSVEGFGSLPGLGGAAGSLSRDHVVAIAASPGGAGYWLATSSGTVYAFGDATPFPFAHPKAPVVALAALPDGNGYWEATASGEVDAFGEARRYGEPGAKRPLASPVVAVASTPDGRGYYVATRSGTVYAYGDASSRPRSSEGTVSHHATAGGVVAMAASPAGRGYWLLLSSGRVLATGSASSYGAPVASKLSGTAVSIVATTSGHGYWVVTSTGAVYAFGDARYEGRAVARDGIVGAAAG